MPDPTPIEVVLPGASNAISSHDHPVLESGNLSFPQGKYFIQFEREKGGDGFRVIHRLQGVPLIERLIESRKAQYACIVSSPRSAYREVHGSFESQQAVSCDAFEFGEPPLFTPAVLCVRDSEIELNSARDGVHEIWNGRRVPFRVGSRIALGNVIQLEASITHLLSLHADEAQRQGGFAIDIESEPFGFRANLHPKLHHLARYGAGPFRDHLMVHIVTACLARLQRDYSGGDGEDGDSSWESHRHLQGLANHLRDQGLPNWADDEFQPEQVATALYPLKIPADGAASEPEDGA